MSYLRNKNPWKTTGLILMERIWYLDWIPHFSTAKWIDPPPPKKIPDHKLHPLSRNCNPFRLFKMHDEAKGAKPAACPVWSQGHSLCRGCLSWCNSWSPYKALDPNKKWQSCPCDVRSYQSMRAKLNIPLCGRELRSVAYGQSKRSANVPLELTGKPNPDQITLWYNFFSCL